ncbi:glycosyltransferase [Halorussus litoreus]|uniref:glycosyltransferase n=1 Tax=Halorussus litoreus TaxID=1710536 RepID=UPI000E253B75|nr:glycosyltransferase [Halorussus litoreus]
MNFSVLISTYYGEDAEEVDECLESTYNQTVVPDEVVIVKDGPLPADLDGVVDDWANRYPDRTKLVSFEENRGTGEALRVGLSECTHELIAKVDSDDLSVEDRFEKQTAYLADNPDVAAVGSYMREILPNGDERIREVPESPEEVRSYARFRAPITHPTSMYRKSAVESVGGYRDLQSMQDYDLWVRLLVAGYDLANIPDVLVESEVGTDWHARRGGFEYASIEFNLLREFRRMGFLDNREFLLNVCTKMPVRMSPNVVRKLLYSTVLRG